MQNGSNLYKRNLKGIIKL